MLSIIVTSNLDPLPYPFTQLALLKTTTLFVGIEEPLLYYDS